MVESVETHKLLRRMAEVYRNTMTYQDIGYVQTTTSKIDNLPRAIRFNLRYDGIDWTR